MMFKNKGAATAALVGLVWTSAVLADIEDYEFQLVQESFAKGDATVLVRLTNKKTGEPVPDAVIIATRIDMAPEGMETMTAPIEQLPSTESGIYRFKTDLMMEGGWRLSLAAKVQGETGTVDDHLILKAIKQ